MPDFLLEIGCEELPAAFCAAALEQLDARGRALLGERRLASGPSRVLGTPRRLAWLVREVAERQADRETEVRGPSRAAAFDPAGRPTRAATGFAAAQACRVEDLEVRETHVFAHRREAGRPAAEVLAELVPELVGALEFPRTMRWGSGDFRFARPVRWLVALLGEAVVPCEVAGVAAGRASAGQRTLHPGPVAIASPDAYEAALAAAAVAADPQRRRAELWEGVQGCARAAGGAPLRDETLLDEVNFLVEWPTAFLGRFPAEALALPEAVLVTVMRVHQRYFPVRRPDGRLADAFVGVRNGGTDDLDAVVAGNEKVLRARLADARFFYDEDRTRPLAERAGGLEAVSFAPALGSMRQKAERLQRLVGADATAVRAARLCKADRLTHLVYEFPELEGLMGGHYARLDGEPEDVAEAIAEHVLPRAAGDELPVTPAGRRLAVADRIDSLVGHFAVGRAPTGSADPFGLRRQALAVLRILRVPPEADAAAAPAAPAQLVRDALEAYGVVGPALPAGADPQAGVLAFLRGRLEGLLAEEGHRYDVARAVLGVAGWAELPLAEVWRRVQAVERLLAGPHADDVLTAHRRAANLARQAEMDAVRPELFADPAETALHGRLESVTDTLRRAPGPDDAGVEAGDDAAVYDAFYADAATLRQPVDAFLDAVLVMAPDPAVRANRLALLRRVADLLNRWADLGQLVV